LSNIGSNVANQASGLIQDIQKREEGVQEWAIQQPMYVDSIPEEPTVPSSQEPSSSEGV
jgi:hypothetical protein